jgi:hypothetical protein
VSAAKKDRRYPDAKLIRSEVYPEDPEVTLIYIECPFCGKEHRHGRRTDARFDLPRLSRCDWRFKGQRGAYYLPKPDPAP